MAPADVYPGPRSPWVPAAIWMAGAIFVWAISAVGAMLTAGAIAALPQPNQRFWIQAVSWSPLLPVALAIGVAAVSAVRRKSPPAVTIRAAHAILWPSALLIFLWIPKAP